MAPQRGNKYWQLREKHGRNKKYTPDELLDVFYEYAEWIDENPFKEAVLVQKGITIEQPDGKKKTTYQVGLPKMRPYTLSGFCIYAGITTETFGQYRKQDDFSDITTYICEVIKTQKFEGAASGFFNANIIARDLGLTDKKSHEVIAEQPLFGDDED